MKALPSRISMAPKGQAATQVSQPVQVFDMTRTLTECSFEKKEKARR
jgi:hypothetical protein